MEESSTSKSTPAGSIPRPIWLLGWTSLFTDAGTEMIYPLLPVYLSRVLGAGAVSLGLIEGVAEALNSALRIWSGYLADRSRRKRPIVIAGYTLSSIARPLIALTTSWPQVLAVRALDRTGKGIRGAPRDSMLAQMAGTSERGRIFGFQRAMDHAGAIVGPLIATAFLFLLPGSYRLLFALTAIPGALAVGCLFLVAEPPATGGNPPGAGRELTAGASSAPTSTARLPGRLWAFLAVLLIFSLGNSADAFLLLRLTYDLGDATYVPLIWSGLHVVKASFSTWGGSLSDRLGRKTVIILGWTIYAVVYLAFAMETSLTMTIVWFLIYGAYFALAEGAEKALITDLTPAGRRGAAFGWYNAVLGAGALTASVGFGFLYSRLGPPVAFATGSALAAVAAVALTFVRTSPEVDGQRQ
jgi:MFS family permease